MRAKMSEVYRGYKGFTKDLKCRGMQYEIGKTYHQSGRIMTCNNGLHFCKTLSDVFLFYYPNHDCRYCEVEAFGSIDFSHNEKFAASDIRIIRELSNIEINRCKYGCGCGCGWNNTYFVLNYGCGSGNGIYGLGNGSGYGNGDYEACGNVIDNDNFHGYDDYNINGIQNILIFEEV